MFVYIIVGLGKVEFDLNVVINVISRFETSVRNATEESAVTHYDDGKRSYFYFIESLRGNSG